jgi:transposase
VAGGDWAESEPLGDGASGSAPGLDAQKKSVRAQEQDQEARREWITQARQQDAQQLVFLDECGVNTTLHRLYARAPRGQRAVGVVPRNWKHNTTVVGALSLSGVQAVMTLEGALDTGAFEMFVEHFLVPALVPGQIVILDNLSVHKSACVRERVRERIEAAGCSIFFLPTYSPDLNPIEKLWSQFKSYLRREAARTQEQLDALIWPTLCRATTHHIRNWFNHAGYS